MSEWLPSDRGPLSLPFLWRDGAALFLIVVSSSPMADERNAFYVVRKGDVIGIYKNLSDCQDQAGSSVNYPSHYSSLVH